MRKEWINPRSRISQLTEENVFEISSKPKSMKDDKLSHLGNSVLQYSKLLLLKFVFFIEEHLLPGSFKILYLGKIYRRLNRKAILILDTDSIFLALTDAQPMPKDFEKDFHQTWLSAFQNIVKPEKMKSWINLSPNWFVLDQSPETKRRPGNISSLLSFNNFSVQGF